VLAPGPFEIALELPQRSFVVVSHTIQDTVAGRQVQRILIQALTMPGAAIGVRRRKGGSCK
jgi:hypothetical protein